MLHASSVNAVNHLLCLRCGTELTQKPVSKFWYQLHNTKLVSQLPFNNTNANNAGKTLVSSSRLSSVTLLSCVFSSYNFRSHYFACFYFVLIVWYTKYFWYTDYCPGMDHQGDRQMDRIMIAIYVHLQIKPKTFTLYKKIMATICRLPDQLLSRK